MFFFKRKPKENKELDLTFQKVIQEIDNLDDKDNPRKIEHYILDSCEHIISTAKEIEANEAQFKVLSDHLSDINKIQSMPDEKKSNLKDLSDNVLRLTKRKRDFKESEKRITDDTFVLLQEHEDSVVEDIRRMEENEKYKARVEADIRVLEAEKSHWEIEMEELSYLISNIRIASVVTFVLVMLIVCAWLILPSTIIDRFRLAMLFVMFIGVLVALILFLVIGQKRKEYRVAVRELNQKINLLNIERMRFVNVQKALSYEMEVYDVRSSGELKYLWEEYIKAVRELEAFRRNNLDLTYYVDRLYKLFKSIDLKYERKWLEQISVIVDNSRMDQLKAKLATRSESIKEHIISSQDLISKERAEIDALIKEHNFYVPEVLEIIASVDSVCNRVKLAISA